MSNNGWEIIQSNYDKEEARKYETLFTLSNGYRGIRGANEFSQNVIYGNYIAGIFDKADAKVTELVNAQNPVGFTLYADDEKVDLDCCTIQSFKRILNMKEAVLYSELTLETRSGRAFRIKNERFVSKHGYHRWAARYFITSLTENCKFFIENKIDGSILNNVNKPYYRVKHYDVKEAADMKPGLIMGTTTHDKKMEIVETATVRICSGNEAVGAERRFSRFGEKLVEIYQIHAVKEQEYAITKYGAAFTSRDSVSNPYEACKKELYDFLTDGYEREREKHIAIWSRLWEGMDIRIDGDGKAQAGIRFNIFHLCACAYESDPRISIAAKALHGEGYKGHVFWDTEIYMLPFYIYTQPRIARALLLYRYNLLEGARLNASANGFKGAQYPWESADDGTEVTPKWGFDYDGNPVRIWTGDEEFHINSDITYAIWEYYRATLDEDFLKCYGVGIFLDTSRFWQSRLEYNNTEGRYEVNCVIGPDEFHEHVNNNVYTNYLAKWSMKKSIELAHWLRQKDPTFYEGLLNKLGLSEEDFLAWERILPKIYLPDCSRGSLIKQFDGYFKLKNIKITEYDENGIPYWPDLKGCKLGETQLVKQADVVMLMIMLQEEFDLKTMKRNYEYYEKRTMHKSSLSPSMYSIMGLMVGDTKRSYSYFMKTISTDLDDNQGNTNEGLHAAASGGSWQTAVLGFGGFGVDVDGIPHFNPWIPDKWDGMEFRIHWRGSMLTVAITKDKVTITGSAIMKVRIFGKEYCISENESVFSER